MVWYNKIMGITDRISKIAKSYINDAKDSLENEFDEFADKFRDGSLGEELMERFDKLRGKMEAETDSIYEEDYEKILRDDGYYKSGNTNNNQQSSTKRSRKQENKLDDAYKKLGVPKSATLKEIEKAYKKEIRKYHPDHFAQDPEKAKVATKVSQVLSEAFEIIKKSKK
jgi:DnaJ-domain-containing protein 1